MISGEAKAAAILSEKHKLPDFDTAAQKPPRKSGSIRDRVTFARDVTTAPAWQRQRWRRRVPGRRGGRGRAKVKLLAVAAPRSEKKIIYNCSIMDFFWQVCSLTNRYLSPKTCSKLPIFKTFCTELFGWSFHIALVRTVRVELYHLRQMNEDPSTRIVPKIHPLELARERIVLKSRRGG